MTQSFTMLGTVVEYVRVYPDPVLEAVVAFKLKDTNGNILPIRTRYQSHALQHVLKLDDEVHVVGELRRYKGPDGGPLHLVIWATHVFLAPRHVLAKTAAAVQSSAAAVDVCRAGTCGPLTVPPSRRSTVPVDVVPPDVVGCQAP